MLDKKKLKENEIKKEYLLKLSEIDKMEDEMAGYFIKLQGIKYELNRSKDEANILFDEYEKERDKNDKSN